MKTTALLVLCLAVKSFAATTEEWDADILSHEGADSLFSFLKTD